VATDLVLTCNANPQTLKLTLSFVENDSWESSYLYAQTWVRYGGVRIRNLDMPRTPGMDIIHGTVHALEQGTSYEVEVIFKRVSNIDGSELESQSIVNTYTTRDVRRENLPVWTTGRTIYVSPTGSDSNAGTIGAPVLSLRGVSRLSGGNAIQPGDRVLLTAGTYYWNDGTSTANGGDSGAALTLFGQNASFPVNGSADAYILVESEPGTIIKGWEYINDAADANDWALHSGTEGVAGAIFKKTGVKKRISQAILDKECGGTWGVGKRMLTYNSLSTDAESPFQYAIENHSDPGIYRQHTTDTLFVKMPDGSKPTSNSIKFCWRAGVVIQFASYIYFDASNITFEGFGNTNSSNTPVGDNQFGLAVGNSAHDVIVYRPTFSHCMFDHTTSDLSSYNVTWIEPTVTCNGAWDRFMSREVAPVFYAQWQIPKMSPMCFAAFHSNASFGHGLVVMNMVAEGCEGAFNLTTATTNANLDCDYIDCQSDENNEELIEAEGGTNTDTGGNRNAYFAFISGTGATRLAGFSTIPFGPQWYLNCDIAEYWLAPLKPGQNGTAPDNKSNGHKYIVNCRAVTDRDFHEYGVGYTGNIGFQYANGTAGNLHVINTIIVGNRNVANFQDGPVAASSPNEWRSTVLYNAIGPASNGFTWDTTSYNTPEALDTAQADITLDVIDDVNPYPAGFDGPLNPLLPASETFWGVTNLAGDAAGIQYGSFVPRGPFPQFSWVSATARRVGFDIRPTPTQFDLQKTPTQFDVGATPTQFDCFERVG